MAVIARSSRWFPGSCSVRVDCPFVVLFEQDGADQTDDRASLGKMPTTSVRRLISPFSRSSGFVLWILARCSLGNAHVGKHVGLGVIHQRGQFRHPRSQLIGDPCATASRASSASSCANAVPIQAATMRRLCLAGMRQHLRMKCTRQRCHEAFSTLATADLSPSCASEIDQPDAAQTAACQACAGSRSRRPRPRWHRSSCRALRGGRRCSTPTAMITATETMRPFWRTFT